MRKVVLKAAVLGVILNLVGLGYAQELETAIGVLIEKSPTSITIQEMDYEAEADEYINVSYRVTPNTEVINAPAIDKIKIDTEISVEYEIVGGEKIATSVYVFDDEEFVEDL